MLRPKTYAIEILGFRALPQTTNLSRLAGTERSRFMGEKIIFGGGGKFVTLFSLQEPLPKLRPYR